MKLCYITPAYTHKVQKHWEVIINVTEVETTSYS